MTVKEFWTYYNAISVLDANENLVQMGVSDYPHMKGDSRKKFHDQFSKAIRPIKKKKSIDDLAGLF